MMAQPGLLFAHKLAGHLGCANVDRMLRGMTSSQLARWEAFYLVEPWGAEIENHRSGVVASTVANFAGKVAPKGKMFSPLDFFPRPDAPRAAKGDPADLVRSRFTAWANAAKAAKGKA